MEPLKKLEELGISPAPWKHTFYNTHENGRYTHLGEVWNGDMRKIVVDQKQPDAQIMSAAPDMYDALWDLLFGKTGYCNVCKGHELGNCPTCPQGKAMAALEKAGGLR